MFFANSRDRTTTKALRLTAELVFGNTNTAAYPSCRPYPGMLKSTTEDILTYRSFSGSPVVLTITKSFESLNCCAKADASRRFVLLDIIQVRVDWILLVHHYTSTTRSEPCHRARPSRMLGISRPVVSVAPADLSLCYEPDCSYSTSLTSRTISIRQLFTLLLDRLVAEPLHRYEV